MSAKVSIGSVVWYLAELGLFFAFLVSDSGIQAGLLAVTLRLYGVSLFPLPDYETRRNGVDRPTPWLILALATLGFLFAITYRF